MYIFIWVYDYNSTLVLLLLVCLMQHWWQDLTTMAIFYRYIFMLQVIQFIRLNHIIGNTYLVKANHLLSLQKKTHNPQSLIYDRYFLFLYNHWLIVGISFYFTIIDLLLIFPFTIQSLIYCRYVLLLYNHLAITGISCNYTIIDLLPVFPVTIQSLIYCRYFL